MSTDKELRAKLKEDLERYKNFGTPFTEDMVEHIVKMFQPLIDKSVNEARENEMELLDDQLDIPSCKEDCSKSEHLLHTGKYEYFEMIDNYVERRRNELANLNKKVGK